MNDIFEVIRKDFSVKLSEESHNLIAKGFSLLEESNNQINGLKHSLNLLEYLKVYLKYYKGQVDLEPLFLAIFWHDVWKVGQKRSFLGSLFGLFCEGKKSKAVFLQEARKFNLSQSLAIKTGQIIEEHGQFCFIRRDIESKIFHDIDQIDSDSKKRLELQKRAFKGNFLLKELYDLQKYFPKRYYLDEIKKVKQEMDL